ncbi:MAG TPA: putative 2OG-Fe(II) oxygenase, partial [Micropepsaceae bacterium]
MITQPALYLMEALLPSDLVDKVNAHIDAVRPIANDYASSLVGQIRRDKKSAQLQMDLQQNIPEALAGVIAQIGTEYLRGQGFAAKVTPNDMWSVHSYEGDYNPLHDHGGNTVLGLSSILYLKVPATILEKRPVDYGRAPSLTMATGNCDGFTQFVWGATGIRDFALLRPPTQQYVKPEAGKLLIFPNWLLHRVEPFYGEGERRTLSCNLDVAFT